MSELHIPDSAARGRRRAFLGALAAGLIAGAPAVAQDGLDVCGCADMPSLGAFENCDTTTFPPGAYLSGAYVYIPLPEDGVLVFDSMRLRHCRSGFDGIAFVPNAANTPVTLLVKEWVYVSPGAGFDVRGSRGGSGSAGRNGRGGPPGPGGFRGGEGGHVDSVGTPVGGHGLGATGGAPGASAPLSRGQDGLFFGADTALPLTGGTGGGGGSETGSGGSCSGGGGGGGGGALLVAANGYIRNDGEFYADGGAGGNRGNGSCASYGGRGSGGTIRLVSPRVYGSGQLRARGGPADDFGAGSNAGLIRIESFDDTHTAATGSVSPPAVRTRVVSPLVNPVASGVAITAIDGQPVPQPPRGNVGLIDLLVDTPGFVSLRIDTQGVPGGTTVEVAVKPDVGGDARRQEVTLEPGNCDDAGACFAVTSFDLAEGAYYAEAAATYRTPSP